MAQVFFKKLTLRGFLTFKAEVTFVFPQSPGLYRVTGRNEEEPQLGANNCGKSSLFAGLCWCLYGKTPLGLKASDISNWKDEEPTVCALELEAEDSIMVLSRHHDPNRLLLDGEDVDQERVDELIGLTYEAFLATALMGQFNKFFFDLGAAEKLKTFDGLLGLERWQEASKQANQMARVLEEEIIDLGRQKAGLVGRKQQLIKQKEELTLLSQRFKNTQSEQLDQAKQKLDQVKEAHLAAEKAYLFQVGRFNKFEPKLEARKQALVEADTLLKPILQREACRQTEVKQAERQLTQLKTEKKCPTCGQSLPGGKADKKQIQDQESTLAGYREHLQLVQKAVADYTNQYQEAEALLVRGEGYLREVEDLRQKTGRTLSQKANDLRQAQKEVDRLSKDGDPYEEQLQTLEAPLAEVRLEVKALKGKIQELETNLEALGYWPKGFRDLRLWLVGEAVAQLTVEVSNSLLELGLDGWSVDCAVEKENKGGTVSKGFAVSVTSPQSEKPVKWEAWGGGVRQRLRVAGAVGLAALARARLSCGLDFEVWDEPTAHLSVEGVKDLLAFFADRAQAEGRIIFVIDHRSLSAGDFDGEVVVVKRITGSEIEQETLA